MKKSALQLLSYKSPKKIILFPLGFLSGFFGYKSHFTALYLFVLVLTFSSQGKPFRICIGEVQLDVSDSKL